MLLTPELNRKNNKEHETYNNDDFERVHHQNIPILNKVFFYKKCFLTLSLLTLFIIIPRISYANALCFDLLTQKFKTPLPNVKSVERILQEMIQTDQDLFPEIRITLDGIPYQIRGIRRGNIESHPVELVLKKIGVSTDTSQDPFFGEEKTLLSSKDLSSDGSILPYSIYPSPNGNLLLVKLSKNGSTDHFNMLTLEIPSGKIIAAEDGVSSVEPRWISLSQYTLKGTTKIYNSKDLQWVIFYSENSSRARVKNLKTNRMYEMEPFPEGKIIWSNENGDFIILSSGSKGNGEVIIFNNFKQTAIIPEDQFWIKTTFVDENFLYVEKIYSEEVKIERWGLNGQKKGELEIPHFASIEWGNNRSLSPANTFKDPITEPNPLDPHSIWSLRLSSPVHEAQMYYYDFKTNSWLDSSLKKLSLDEIKHQLLTHEGEQYEVGFLKYRSQDETEIPLRYTQKLGRSSDQVALLLGYGGYGRVFHFYPQYDPFLRSFLQQGGLILAPALRGGSYLGSPWTKSGQGENKMKVSEDLISAAKFAVEQGWVKRGNIISVGYSHGGLISAQAMQAQPDLFRLVILQSAPLDLLHKEELDGPIGIKVRQEYGDFINDPKFKNILKKLSPLENLTPQRYPQVILFLGEGDTRVNPEHMRRYYRALQISQLDLEKPPLLIEVPKVGHKMKYISYHGDTAADTLLKYWSLIFQELHYEH